MDSLLSWARVETWLLCYTDPWLLCYTDSSSHYCIGALSFSRCYKESGLCNLKIQCRSDGHVCFIVARESTIKLGLHHMESVAQSEGIDMLTLQIQLIHRNLQSLT